MTTLVVWLAYWIVAAAALVGVAFLYTWLRSLLPRGTVQTSKGAIRGPSDAELRRARRFFAPGDLGRIPIHTDLSLIEPDAVSRKMRRLVPRPVREGCTVLLMDRQAGPLDVVVDLVVPRPQDGVAAGQEPFQYVGRPVSPEQPWRLQFDHAMIWAVTDIPPIPEDGHGEAEKEG